MNITFSSLVRVDTQSLRVRCACFTRKRYDMRAFESARVETGVCVKLHANFIESIDSIYKVRYYTYGTGIIYML